MDFTAKEIELMIKLSLVKKAKFVSLHYLANECNIDSTHPYFRKIILYLIDNQVANIEKRNKKIQYISIDKNYLSKLIDNSNLTKLFVEYFEEYHVIVD
jgi:hypothetical protein